MHKVLIIDDEQTIRYLLANFLAQKGFATVEAGGGAEGVDVFLKERPEAVLLDYNMPGMNGLKALKELKKRDPSVPVVILTAYGEVPVVVEAMRAGALDFITKPLDLENLALVINRGIEKLLLEREVKRLNTAVCASLENRLGKSERIKKVIKEISQVAYSDFSVIIEGETGTGKSTVAEMIHNMSRRAERPFTRVDIGVIPDSLVESELFGHEKGAFTGADRLKKGYFEVSDSGTIFIDELENTSHNVQCKLLSAVEEKRIVPMGSTRPVQTDVRIIAATNTDMRSLVKEKKFREDLFFRLSEFVITLPPLRERIDDILFLAKRFLFEASAELNKASIDISEEAIEILKSYSWPGNVRELKNVVRRAVLLSNRDSIFPEDIDFLIKNDENKNKVPDISLKEVSAVAVRDAEIKAIKHALSLANGNKSKTAAMLKVDYKTLLTKIKQYGLQNM